MNFMKFLALNIYHSAFFLSLTVIWKELWAQI